MRTNKNSESGFTLVEIMIVVVIIGLLCAVALPNWVRARTASQMSNCINNLRQIDSAKQQWALETKQSTNAVPELSDISPFLKNRVTCPAAGATTGFGGSYTINNVATRPTCQVSPSDHVLSPDTSN